MTDWWRIIAHFLGGTYFRYFWFPIGGSLLGIWIKIESRGWPARREDFGIGLELMRSSLLMLVALTSGRAVDLDATYRYLDLTANPIEYTMLAAHARVVSTTFALSGIVIFVMFLVLWGTTSFVRECGWERPERTQLRTFRGIVLPGIAGEAALCVVAFFLSS